MKSKEGIKYFKKTDSVVVYHSDRDIFVRLLVCIGEKKVSICDSTLIAWLRSRERTRAQNVIYARIIDLR